jgi:hypothetical protein
MTAGKKNTANKQITPRRQAPRRLHSNFISNLFIKNPDVQKNAQNHSITAAVACSNK